MTDERRVLDGDMTGPVVRAVRDRREQLIDLCRRLVEAPSENPPGDTRDVARVVTSFLAEAGFEVERVVADESAPNLVATIEGHAPGRHLVLNAHMDTILPGDEAAWSVPVHAMTRRDGRLYGLGMGNMKGALAAMCVAAAVLAERRSTWSGAVSLTAVSDEVVFGERGSSYLLAMRPELIADGFLSGEGPGWMRLAVAEKGLAWIEIEARVPPHQAAVVDEGSTAVARLAAVIGEIDGLNATRTAIPADLRGAIEDPEGHGFRLTANVGLIRAGTVINQVATPAVARIDLRLPPGLPIEHAEGLISAITARYGGIRWHRLAGWNANWTAPTSPLPVAVSDAAHAVRGERPMATVRLPASDASRWRAAGVPAVCYGPQPTLAAGVDDHALEMDVVDCAAVYALAATTFCSVTDPGSASSHTGVSTTPPSP